MINTRQKSSPGTVLLCNTPHGRALRCSCCGRAEVTYGNAVLSLSLGDLESVLGIIDSFDANLAPDPLQGQRTFRIHTQNGDVGFAFSRAEMIELGELLRGTRAAMRAVAVSTPGPVSRTRVFH